MIPVLNEKEIAKMRSAGSALSEVFKAVQPFIKEGVSTQEINDLAESKMRALGCTPPCKGYHGYPAAICVSIDETVVHGIPSSRKLKAGEIVSVDMVLRLDGFCADATRTYAIGEVSPEKLRLIAAAKRCFDNGVAKVKAGARLGDLQNAIQLTAELSGYSVIRAMTGHGIGRNMHEEPVIENHGRAGTGPMLRAGMCLAIEPMIAIGGWEVEIDRLDGWTCRTADRKPAAHYENTVLVTASGYEILTEI